MYRICSLKVSGFLDLLSSNRCHGNIASEKHQNLLTLRRLKAEIRVKMKESTVNLCQNLNYFSGNQFHIKLVLFDLGGLSEVLLPSECYVPSSHWGSTLRLVIHADCAADWFHQKNLFLTGCIQHHTRVI